MNFENAFLGPRSIQVYHLRSKIPLTDADWLREQPRLIQQGRWPPRVLCCHSSSPPWPCAQQVAAAARRNATAAHEGEGKGGGSCRPMRSPRRPRRQSSGSRSGPRRAAHCPRRGWSSPTALTMHGSYCGAVRWRPRRSRRWRGPAWCA